VRLAVYVAADEARIERALAASEPGRRLVENGWLHLFRLATDGRCFRRRVGGGYVPALPVPTPASSPQHDVPLPPTPRAHSVAPERLRGMLGTMVVLFAAVLLRSWFGA
jgi:hypothetical protein